MKNGLGDLWMPCVCFLGLLASLGFGLNKVTRSLDCTRGDVVRAIHGAFSHGVGLMSIVAPHIRTA